MLRKYAAVLLAATLTSSALAQTRAPITSNPTSTGGGSLGYNGGLMPSFAQAPAKPPAPTSISTRPAPKPASTRSTTNLTGSAAPTAGGSLGYNQNMRPQ
jgi:hypothetical protein